MSERGGGARLGAPLRGCVTGFGLALCVALPGEAAEIALSSKPGCAATLSGPIVPQDVAPVTAFMAEHLAGTAGDALCLDSPGGAFQAAHEIAVTLHELAIATRIGPGDSCVSACALVFMAGRIAGEENDGPKRVLHVDGQLGFHAPYTALDPATALTGEDVNAFIPAFTDMIAGFIRHGANRSFSQYRSSISLGLLTEMLDTPPDEMFMVDTTDRAARWGVELEGVGAAPGFSLEHYVQLCDNELAWVYDERANVVSEDLSTLPYQTVQKNIYGTPTEMLVLDRGGMAPITCEVERVGAGAEGLGFCLTDGFTGLGLGACNDPVDAFSIWVPWWHAVSPDTPLGALK